VSFITSFILGFIPWQVWIVFGAAVACLAFLHIPTRFGGLAAGIILAITFTIAGGARGITEGRALEKHKWEKAAEQERERLATEFEKVRKAEEDRRLAAERRTEELESEIERINNDAARDTSGAIVVPESIARRLFDLRAKSRGGKNR
jgi:hypothetical protein